MSQLPVVHSRGRQNPIVRALAVIASEDVLDDTATIMSRLIAALSVTKRNVVSRLVMLRALIPKKSWVDLTCQLAEEEKISKKQLITLFGLGSLQGAGTEPLITLSDLVSVTSHGKQLFTHAEIVRLATDYRIVSNSDVAFILNTPALSELLPLTLLKCWIGQDASTIKLSELSKARLAECLFRQDRKLLTVDMLKGGLYAAANVEPGSGAVQIFLNLLYQFDGVRSRKGKDTAREVFAHVISGMICPTRPGISRHPISFFEGQKLLGWYLTNPMILQADREWVENEITSQTNAYGEMYISFIEVAKRDSPFSIC